ncbi:MAG TPA: S53 family peptidase [Pseudonocardiaceae bacterium]|jgi:subtilase family serine protease|nr:S53 family peptidase [Pseudonocardiaceae bacterium]
MTHTLLTRRRGRVAATMLALAASAATVLSLAAAPAQAAPLATRLTPAAPVAGLTMNFGCATTTGPGQVHCLGKMRAKLVPTGHGQAAPLLMSGPTGLGAPDLESAYKVAGLSSGGRTVAIVDAFDDPNAEADLGVYRKQYGLAACTTANGCFKKVNGNGATSPLPTADAGWAEEESLDLDMVSSVCPDCHILLVEAASADNASLETAVDSAAASGAASISNSYGEAETGITAADDAHYNHPGHAVTVSSGDSGFGVEWPASSPWVTAVGGTSLTKASNARGWTETAWSGAGSGCSASETKPAWQTDSGCAKRTVADVSAVADPNTGVAVYDTYNTCGSNAFCDLLIELGLVQGADGWVQVGGTSASSPIVASVYALAGNTGTVNYGSFPYSHTSSLFDVTSGSNGSCGGTYLCTAGAGYDGPTGLGTPNGTGAF